MPADPLHAWRLLAEPYYAAQGDELAAFEAAHALRLPVLLKGPTGCGKTRFVEHMAWRLGKPLVTVAATMICRPATWWAAGCSMRRVHAGRTGR